MTQNLCYVLALCVGQVGGAASPYASASNSPAYQQAVPAAQMQTIQSMPQGRGGLRGWFQSRFGFQTPQVPCGCMNPSAPVYAQTIAPMQPGLNSETAAPSGSYMPGQPGLAATTAPPLATHEESEPPAQSDAEAQGIALEAPIPIGPNPANTKIDQKYESKIGHDPDYSWITGHLFYVHADGGRWVVRYALPGEIDKFGGSVVLAPGVEMKNFREGDLVCVVGEILNEARTSASLGGALYRVNSIQIVERSDP